MQPLINGTAYSWSQIILTLFGQAVAGVTQINYSDVEEMEDNKGAGKYPVSRSYGGYSATAQITLEMAEVEALQAAVPDGRLQSIPEFDIIVSYLPEGGVIANHTIKNCRFKNNGRETSTDNMRVVVQLDIQTSHILWQ